MSSSERRIVGVEEADDGSSLLFCNSGIVLTARISDTSVGDDGDDASDEETLGIDNVLLVLFVVVVVVSIVVYIVVEVGDGDGDGTGRK